MTDRPELARAATDVLSARRLEREPPSPEVRARAIEAGRRAVRDLGQRSRRRRVVGVAGGFALAAAVVFGVVRIANVGPRTEVVAQVHVTTSEGVDLSRADPSRITAGDRFTSSGIGRLTLSSGTRFELTAAQITVLAPGVFGLDRGAARFDVAKLAPGERFVVRASDVEVEVRGTTFDVALIAPGTACGPVRVAVTEGVVVVRRAGLEDRLGAGDAWPRDCGSKPATPAPAPSATIAPPSLTSSSKKAAPPSSVAPSLEAQNALYSEALAAKNRGERALALQLFERFLIKYPSSGLAENASVERMRLLSGAARVAAAKAYLAKYPKGFARAEAAGIAGP